jgi:acetolactate synthase-1/2/3 large subunit
MAEAVGKATGRPGLCFVTRGPGATNAAAGVHIAQQDSTPLILFVGQVARRMREREAFQELDYRAVYGSIAKWATEIDDPARIPELVSRAFYTATSGRPGPVVIALPEDMLTERAIVADAPAFAPVETSPGPHEMKRFAELLAQAQRPIVLLGGSRWSAEACAQVQKFAEDFSLPVATTFRRAHLFDPEHPNYAGDLGIGPNPKLLARVKGADLIVLIGGRLGEMPSQGYTLLDIPGPSQTFVHVHPGAEELGRVYRPHLAVHASPAAFANALTTVIVAKQDRRTTTAATARDGHTTARDVHDGHGTTATAHAEFLDWTDKPAPVPGGVNLSEIICALRAKLPPDAVICNGAGNFSIWVHRYSRYRRYGSELAPIAGSMGYGVPAAIAMKRLAPERLVIAFAGDGDFLMTGQELATAVQYDLPVLIVIADNGMYGTIRMHQERHYPGRVVGTGLRNPDFAAVARAYGAFGVTVERTVDFAQAFEAAQESGRPAVIHLKIDPQAITPTATLDGIREKALSERR